MLRQTDRGTRSISAKREASEALAAELAAINQYFAHSKLCDNWGWKRLAEKYREESFEEMRDAEHLIDRIILLDGMPNMQRMDSVRIGETVREQLEEQHARLAHVDALLRHSEGALALLDGDAGVAVSIARVFNRSAPGEIVTPILPHLRTSPSAPRRRRPGCQCRGRPPAGPCELRRPTRWRARRRGSPG